MRNPPAPRRPARALTLAVVIVGAAAVVGAVALWPRDGASDGADDPVAYVDATVTGVDEGRCLDADGEGRVDCQVVTAELTSGPDRGEEVDAAAGALAGDPAAVDTGDRVVLVEVSGVPLRDRYAFAGFQRSVPLLWLALAFVLVVVAVCRHRGVRILLALAAAGAVLVAFVAPALLDDQPAVPVVLAGAALMGVAVLYLGHGFSLGTTVALAGTLASLAAVCGLAVLVAAVADLTGLAGSEAGALDLTSAALDGRGVLVAGIVIGALGALGDVTVSQVSIIAALRRANPVLGPRLLYHEARRVGHDHVGSAVTTLVLAYAGASLPLVLLVAQGDQPAGRLVTGDLVSVEIVRMVVGSLGLVLAAPVTAALAAVALGPGDGDAGGHRNGTRPSQGIEDVPAHLPAITRGG